MKITSHFLIAVAVFAAALPFSAAAACTTLSSDMSQGVTDARSNGQVTILQKFLSSAGYLSVSPNGVFGPSTYAAVKAFQTANSIAVTGSVGPLTRMAINIKSCGGDTGSAASAASQSPAFVALNPATGESLAIGQSYTLKWSGPAAGTTYNVTLEDSSGTPQGFIVHNTSATKFDWQVGSVNNSNAGTVSVPPGNYRIHVQSASQGGQSTDKLSGVFSIGTTVSIDQVIPQTIKADGKSSVVIFGSGFSSASVIDIYGYGSVGIQYVSPDGKIAVFQIPSGISQGAHSISIANLYKNALDSSDIRINSRSTNIVVVP